MYTLLFWKYYCDQKVKNAPLFFFLVFARIGGKRTGAKDQKQTIYFKRPNLVYIKIMDIVDILYRTIRCISSFLSIGNLFVLILIIKFEYLRTKQNAFIFLLAVCDSIYGLIALPSLITLNMLNAVYKPNMSESTYEAFLAACQFRCVFSTFAFYGDYLSIGIIMFDRFYYIRYPFQYNQYVNNTKIGCIIGLVVSLCFITAIIFVFGSGGVRRSGKCSVTMFVPPIYFIYIDIPIICITTILMFYSFYHYYEMARKIQPEGADQSGNIKRQIKVTRTMFTVVGVFLSSNIIWYTVFFIIDGLELEGFGISLVYWFADALWLVSHYLFLN